MNVGWDAPDQTGGSPVTSYQVAVNDGNPASVSSVSGADRTASLPNIKAGI